MTTRKSLVRVGTAAAAALLTVGGMSAAQAAGSPVETTGTKASSKSNATYAYAHATWKWKGAGSTGKIKVYVNDQRCRDGWDSFAFMQFKEADGPVVTGESRIWNDNSDCKGKGISETIGGFSAGYNVRYGRVVVCKNDVWGTGDTCKNGKWHRNPKA